mgnify:CR=1 FL=1
MATCFHILANLGWQGLQNILTSSCAPWRPSVAVLQVSGVTTPLLPNKSLAAVRPYASAVVSLGNRLGIPVVDLYSSLQSVPSWQSTLFTDGLHFTPEGSRAVWREVLGVMQKDLPQVR